MTVGRMTIQILQKRTFTRPVALVALVGAALLGCDQGTMLPLEPHADLWESLREAGKGLSVIQAPTTPPEPPVEEAKEPTTLKEQREQLYARIKERLLLSSDAMSKVQAIFEKSSMLSQGNPEVSKHPMSRAECRTIRQQANLPYYTKHAACGELNMVPVYNPAAGQSDKDATLCIDQYEFPNLPCEYPVVHVRANEAVKLCEAVGKRLCDAHEWEGACAGAVRPVEQEYAFGKTRMEMKWKARTGREMLWSYGKEKDHGKCATKSKKTDGCGGGGWKTCGSNTYPAGAFPLCVSPFGVFDLHGNAAEHMNLPMTEAELASQGKYGETEMKGSWFIFSRTEAHEDDCRWRAPDWHVSKVMDDNSHRNYHLGFRCCKDVKKP